MFRPDRLVLGVSLPLAGLVIAVHLLAMVAVLVCELPLLLRFLLLAAIVYQAVYLLRRYVFLKHFLSVREIRWTELSWFVRLADGSEWEVQPAPGCRVYAWITLLRFQSLDPVARRHFVISAWLLDGYGSSQAMRRLRVQLIQSYPSQNSQV